MGGCILLILPPVSAPNHKLQKPSKESGIFWSLVTINLNVLSLKGNIKPPLNTLLRTPLMLLCKNYGDPIIFYTATMYDLIQGKAREIGSKHCCYNLYFMKCVFLTGKCYASVHSTDQKNHLHTSDFAYSSLRFKQGRRNWSPTLFKFSLFPASIPFCRHAHKQINIVSYYALKSFPSKKTPRCSERGP